MCLRDLLIILIAIPFIYGLYQMISNTTGWLRIIIIVVYLVTFVFYLCFKIVELFEG